MFYILLSFVILFLILKLLYARQTTRPLQIENLKSTNHDQKPILLIIVDSLMEKPLSEAMRSGRAPAFKFLCDQGYFHPKMISSFPTMSVTIDSTLLTGAMPNQHHIFGLNYYDPKQKQIINLGTGAKEAIAVGLKRIFLDTLIRLNQHFLSPHVKTIHEAFNGPTASINAFVYRDHYQHTLRIPWSLRLISGLPQQIEINGPALFSLGALHKISPKSRFTPFWLRYGGNDRFTTDELIFLINKQLLPPFTIAYFPSNDDAVHQKGTAEIKGIEKVDKALQSILNSFPSWKEAIEQTTFIILGDSGQTDTLADQQQAFVDMSKILSSYRVTDVKKGKPANEDQLVCCVNERMTYIYLLDDQLSFQELTQWLQQEKRFDLIAWQEKNQFHVISGNKEGIIHFSPGGNQYDEYGQHWTVEGNLAILDLTIQDQKIIYGIYPDVLNRLSGVSKTYDRVIIVTVAPGYEMIFGPSPKHRGASHGSLHYMDTYVPMIVAGTDSKPEHNRLIDLKPWILNMLTKE